MMLGKNFEFVAKRVHQEDISITIKEIQILGNMEVEIDESFLQLSRLLRVDKELKKDDKVEIKVLFRDLYELTKRNIEIIKHQWRKGNNNIDNDEYIKNIEICINIHNNMRLSKETYYQSQEDKLNKVIYGNINLKEVKELYS